MDRASNETPRDGATLSTASRDANSLAVAVNVCPSPVVKRKRMGLWESIIIEEAKKKARIAAAAECAQKPTATFTSEEESAGEEASCSSEVDLPEQQATASDGDRQGEGKPMGTPLNEPLVGEDGKQFHPILEFLAYHAKVKVECAKHGVFVVPSPCVVYRRRSVDDVPEPKVAKTS